MWGELFGDCTKKYLWSRPGKRIQEKTLNRTTSSPGEVVRDSGLVDLVFLRGFNDEWLVSRVAWQMEVISGE